MGPDHLGELNKPTRNIWVEQKIQEDAFGSEGAGLEFVVAGGMHSLFIDEKGTVSIFGPSLAQLFLNHNRYGRVVSTTMLR